MKIEFIIDNLNDMFPDAHCELNYHNAFELLCAVSLSAQTTDISVNKVTGKLFKKYPDARTMSQANLKDVQELIKTIGLYRNKASNLILMSKQLIELYDGKVPASRSKLMVLKGVGRKTANVLLAEYFKIPALAIDTHVSRVAKRLGLAKKDDEVSVIETKLKRKFPRNLWHKLHHQLIFFGRYKCKALKPLCLDCPFIKICKEKIRL